MKISRTNKVEDDKGDYKTGSPPYYESYTTGERSKKFTKVHETDSFVVYCESRTVDRNIEQFHKVSKRKGIEIVRSEFLSKLI